MASLPFCYPLKSSLIPLCPISSCSTQYQELFILPPNSQNHPFLPTCTATVVSNYLPFSSLPMFHHAFFHINIWLKYHWLTVFPVHSKVIQLCKYTYIIFDIIFHNRLLQDIDCSSLCYTVNHHFFYWCILFIFLFLAVLHVCCCSWALCCDVQTFLIVIFQGGVGS